VMIPSALAKFVFEVYLKKILVTILYSVERLDDSG